MQRDADLVPRWLRASRNGTTQDALAQDIRQVTGWNITRDRYSKYESGSLPIGPTVLRHFTDYWASRGVDGPESFMAMPGGGGDTQVPGLADLIARLDRQADLVSALIEQNALLMQTLGLGPLPPADVQEAIREAREQRRTASTLRPSDDPRGTGTRSRARSAG